MSRWAHVTGSVRYDCSYHKDEEIKKLLGKIYRWGDSRKFKYGSPEWESYYEEWESCFDLTTDHIPMGSEGSLEYLITHDGITPDEDGHVSCCADTAVLIWGDLRGVDDNDIDYIKKWFHRITCNNKFLIRQAILQIDDEYSNKFIVLQYYQYWDSKIKKFVGTIIEKKIQKKITMTKEVIKDESR